MLVPFPKRITGMMSPLLLTVLSCWQVKCRGLGSFPSWCRALSPNLERGRIARELPPSWGLQHADLDRRMG